METDNPYIYTHDDMAKAQAHLTQRDQAIAELRRKVAGLNKRTARAAKECKR